LAADFNLEEQAVLKLDSKGIEFENAVSFASHGAVGRFPEFGKDFTAGAGKL